MCKSISCGSLILELFSVIILRTCDLALLRFSRFRKYLDDFSPNSYQFDLECIIMPAVMYYREFLDQTCSYCTE